ncbi:MAG: hypothetical protein H0W73_15115 [Bacteroidetes bacterium]|nr:hypothetical protein [Bacteroidota bacterium]
MGSLSTLDWNSLLEKNFKARSKKKTNSNFSQFDDEFDETENYPQLNRYKKQDHRSSKRKDLRGNFDQV